MKILLLYFENGEEDLLFKIQNLIQSASHIETSQFGITPIMPDLEIRENQRRIYYQEREIPFTKTEYEIFLYLLQNPNRVLTYTQIYERIWKEPDYGEARKLVSHHVQAIRRKMNLEKDSGIYLRCIREVGYSLELR